MKTGGGPWHHAPLHMLLESGVYMVTAGTYEKAHFFRNEERLDLLHDQLHLIATEHGWSLQAWAVFSNHYHFVAASPADPGNLRRMLSKLHTLTARTINQQDATPGRKVWHQFWDTRLTFERSYLARLNYVHQNPVRHRVVNSATTYRWCSAASFETEGDPAFRRTVAALPIDQLEVPDNF